MFMLKTVRFDDFSYEEMKEFIYRKDIKIKQICVEHETGCDYYYIFYKEKWYRRLFKKKRNYVCEIVLKK